MICAQCGHANEADAESCANCGAQLQLAQEKSQNGPTSDAAFLVGMGDREGETHELGHRAVIGRLESSDIAVDDKSVSREHARLSKLRDGYVIEDLGSTNGTKVNGRRINEAVLLRPGDIVAVGSVEFRYASGFVARALHASGSEPAQPHTMVANIFGRLRREPQNQRDESEVEFQDDLVPDAVGHEAAVASDLPEVDLTFDSANPAAALEGETDMNAETSIEPEPARAMAPQDVIAPANTTLDEAETNAHFAIQSLATLARSLASQLSEGDVARTRLQQQLDAATASRSSQEQLLRSLERASDWAVTDQQIDELRTMTADLVQAPRDIEILMRISQNAQELTTLLNETARLRESVRHAVDTLRVSTPPE